MSRKSFDLGLYLVIGPDDCAGRDILEVTRRALAGGVTLVQLRDKRAPMERLVETARALKAVLAPAGVPLIINDSLEAVLATPADGLHLGQDDADPAVARAALGPWAIIGLSAGNEAEAARLDPVLVDYAGCGPAYATGSKADAGAAIGPEGLAALRGMIGLPIVAIGGIKAGNAAAVMATGVEGIAVVSAITAAADPEAVARELRTLVEAGRGKRGAGS
jgi:thiamine-phosphate pyrophosphorylase